ncbi:TMEM175 family protein [Streptomyces sp. NBC_00111]|uniref:TMEM175 family protein n=1 Tax=unclassified Streptomyces TaxID=2593676 RepID=UPI002E2FD42D|nr:TMEM175 family protein [Streptomyces sp. NBC_01460]
MDESRAGTGEAKITERLTALSDGIFAIAMTLLVLDVRVPPGLTAEGFQDAVVDVLPDLGAYALSFMILAAFWRDHRRIMELVPRFDAPPLRFALIWLGAIALIPFPTSLLSEYASQPLAVAVYAGAVSITNLLELAVLRTGLRRSWPKDHAAERTARSIAADLGGTALVFGATVPLAYAVSPAAAMWSWLALVPVKAVLGRRSLRVRSS